MPNEKRELLRLEELLQEYVNTCENEQVAYQLLLHWMALDCSFYLDLSYIINPSGYLREWWFDFPFHHVTENNNTYRVFYIPRMKRMYLIEPKDIRNLQTTLTTYYVWESLRAEFINYTWNRGLNCKTAFRSIFPFNPDINPPKSYFEAKLRKTLYDAAENIKQLIFKIAIDPRKVLVGTVSKRFY